MAKTIMDKKLVYKKEAYDIIGACFEVYNEKGSGLDEPMYQECLELEFSDRKLPCDPQFHVPAFYKGRRLKRTLIPDFLCYEKIILEIKAAKNICDEHRVQLYNYLKATGMKLGLLVNFGHYPGLEWERVVLDPGSRDDFPIELHT